MASGYMPGDRVGSFEVLKKTGSYLETSGAKQGLYLVRCLVCGREASLIGRQLRDKKDCGCRKEAKKIRIRRGQMPKKKKAVWMDEGEIYRSWKQSRDRATAYSVLAQLNDVPIEVIAEIVKRQKEAEEQS